MKHTIKVILFGNELGSLGWDAARNVAYFNFNPDYKGDPSRLFPLAGINPRQVMWGSTGKIYKGLPPFIADSLPDAWGMELFARWRQEHRIPEAQVTPLHLLSYIGHRGMGALEYEPEVFEDGYDDPVDIKALIELSKKIYSDREDARILPKEALTMQALMAVGTSAGGYRRKAILAINPETGEIRSGQIGGLDGFKYYILKFNEDKCPVSELEYAYYEMALAAGIDMAPSRLWKVDGQNHFLTERFDRSGTRKIHIQTLAALAPDVRSYEGLVLVCRKMGFSQVAVEKVFTRMVFNILANNTDDHHKNFSFTMDGDGHWDLAPAYDLNFIFSTAGAGLAPDRAHCMHVGGLTTDIPLQTVMDFARDNDISRQKAEAIIDRIAESIKSFRTIAVRCDTPPEWIGRVETALMDNLRAWDLIPSEKAADGPARSIGGHQVSNLRIEESYGGNFHIFAEIDGKERKFVVTKKKPGYAALAMMGKENVTDDMLLKIIEPFLLK